MNNAAAKLGRLMNERRRWRVSIADGRWFEGRCVCMDRDLNLLIESAYEYRKGFNDICVPITGILKTFCRHDKTPSGINNDSRKTHSILSDYK
jgi:small nuclear ribonucleoprotein (snRNP)-like protein